MESSRQLPSDMIFEVLSRTSLQTLNSSRLVCKEWNNLTYDSNFVELHARNTNIVSGYLVQSMVSGCSYKSTFVCIDGQSSHLSMEFLPRDIKIEASSDQGIFVYVHHIHRRNRYYICKPTTKQVMALPNPKMRYLTEKVTLVVLSSNPLHYKIIRFSRPSHWRSIDSVNSRSRCEIFDSRIWAWKELTDILIPYLPYHEILMSRYPAICVRGSIHMLTNKDRVFAFEIDSESYKIFPLPIPTSDSENYKCKRLVKYKGRLGFTCKAPNGSFELWVMKKSIKEEPFWKKRLVLKTQVLEEKEKYPTIADFYNSGVALVEGYHSAIFYNIRNRKMNVVKLKHQPNEVFSFRADFEPTSLDGRC